MKQIWKPRFRINLTAICIALLFCSVFPVAEEYPSEGLDDGASSITVPAGMTAFSESGDLVLYADPATGEFQVLNKASGTFFYSNPIDRDADEDVRGVPKMRMYSQLLVTVYDADMKDEQQYLSYTGSVMQEGLVAKRLRNGIRFYYNFPDIKITIPLDVVLENEKLSLSVQVDKISCESTFRPTQISIAPFFGSGGTSDEGYLMLPDGSGTLAYFNNHKNQYDEYNQPVYGSDLAYSKIMSSGAIQQKVSLPVFGIKRNKDALLAVISEGESAANIQAYISGMQNNQNTAFATFRLYGTDLVVIGSDVAGSKKSVQTYSFTRPNIAACRVDYYFLTPPNADYSGMARKYAQILRDTHGGAVRRSSGARLFVSLLGGYDKQTSIFGFKVNRFVKLTDFEDTEAIVGQLRKNDVETLSVSFKNWSKAEIQGKLQISAAPVSRLGGNKGLKQLKAVLDNQSSDLYLAYNPLLIAKDGNGFSRFFHAAKKVSGERIQVYTYLRSIYFRNMDYPTRYVVKGGKLGGYFERLWKSFQKRYAGFGLLNSDLAGSLSSDFSKEGGSTREDMIRSAENIFAKNKFAWLFENANAYAIPYAKAIQNVPVESSGFHIADEDIPFYQMVVSGFCDYSAPAINKEPKSVKYIIMKLLETGSQPYFDWIYEPSSEIKDSLYNDNYSANYETWMEKSVALYKAVDTAYNQLGSSILTAHEKLAEGVYRSIYQSGGSVIVNYSDKAYELNGQMVAPQDYLIVKGGNNQ